MRYLSEAVDDFDLINRMDGRGKAAMNAEDLIVDHNAESEEIKHIGEIMPNVCVAVLSGALGVEAIRLCDTSGLMVSADQMHSLRISQF